VILNLSVWFALHVVFGEVREASLLPVPVWASFSWLGAGFTALSVALLLGARLSMGRVLGLMAGLAGAWHLVM
jgi:chromate transporter